MTGAPMTPRDRGAPRYFIGKRRFVREVVKTSPLLVLFAVAWSVGEFFGYAFGDGGASLRVK